MINNQIKTVSAETHFEIWVTCPYCDTYQNQVDSLKEYLPDDEFRVQDITAQCKCEKCSKYFEVNEIEY